MDRSRRVWQFAALMAVIVVSLGTVGAGSTVIDVQLGDRFSGTIAEAGVDTVEARLTAVQDTKVMLRVSADKGSDLRPVIAVRDSTGAPVALDGGFQLDWLPVANVVRTFTVPAFDTYTLEIGGSSGAGRFSAAVTGTVPPNSGLVTLSGVVTNSLTGAPVAGVEIYNGSKLFGVTDAAGQFSGQLPAGTYSLSFQASAFQSSGQTVVLADGVPSTLDVALLPTVPVGVTASVSGTAVVGGSVMATVAVQTPPGTAVQSISWTKVGGPDVIFTGADMATATVTLPAADAFKAALIEHLTEPPISEEDLPPNIPLTGEFNGGLQNRFEVVGINPLALEEAGLVTLKVEVVTDLGTFDDEVEIHTSLPWSRATGLRNVGVESTVLLQGKEQAAYDWALVRPNGSMAMLVDATTRNPHFTPDVPGAYRLTVTDESGAEKAPLTIEVFAGTFRGVIVDQDMDGRPIPDTACTFCHDGANAPDKFTEWRQTGHAEIFTANLNNSTHYGDRCFSCHFVGYDPEAANNGADEAADYAAFMSSGLLNNPGDNWTTMLEQFPATARKANVQCENCHGPQNSFGHGFGNPEGEPRISLSADVCATCHGEPLRHARFQQWQLSRHANYELAISRGESGSCARCHTGNGFLAWLPILLDDDPETDPTASVEVTWTPDEVHPQTCATCHDPHANGTTSGINTNATVRISGDTPPLIAGFSATDVGRGAICMTCHNSRRGLRNDDVFDELSLSDLTRAPHGSSQTDMLMGQNAFFVAVAAPGGHATLGDTCIDCHMEATPPPAQLSYNQSGTNHTFFASTEICSDCHSPHLVAEDVQGSIENLLSQLEEVYLFYVTNLLDDLFAEGYTVDFDGDVTLSDVDQIEALAIGETRGRQGLFVTVAGTEYGPTSVGNIDVFDGATEIGELFEFADPALPKAGWNYFLAHNDGSLGIHNPFFASGALSAARDALLAAPSSVLPEPAKRTRTRTARVEPVRSR